MELNEEIITRLKEEVKAQIILSNTYHLYLRPLQKLSQPEEVEISETAVGYVHVFNKRLEKKLQENNIEYKEDEEVANKQID